MRPARSLQLRLGRLSQQRIVSDYRSHQETYRIRPFHWGSSPFASWLYSRTEAPPALSSRPSTSSHPRPFSTLLDVVTHSIVSAFSQGTLDSAQGNLHLEPIGYLPPRYIVVSTSSTSNHLLPTCRQAPSSPFSCSCQVHLCFCLRIVSACHAHEVVAKSTSSKLGSSKLIDLLSTFEADLESSTEPRPRRASVRTIIFWWKSLDQAASVPPCHDIDALLNLDAYMITRIALPLSIPS